MANYVAPIVIENANPKTRVEYKDFKGTVTQFNKYGTPNFTLLLDPEVDNIEALIAEGWRIKKKEFTEDDRPTKYYMPVYLRYDKEDPPVVDLIINSEDGSAPKGVHLDADTIDTLDDVVFTKVSMIVVPKWRKNTMTGEWTIKAHLARMIVWSDPNYYEMALKDLEDSLEGVIFD